MPTAGQPGSCMQEAVADFASRVSVADRSIFTRYSSPELDLPRWMCFVSFILLRFYFDFGLRRGCMKTRVLAAMLGIGGFFISGCSPADRSAAVTSRAAMAPSGTIRSQSDLQRYLSATASSDSPLSALSSGARSRFLSNITFNEKGITGFHYGDLQSELTASQIFDVLHLFGVERDVAIIPNVRVETAKDRRVISTIIIQPQPVDGTDYRDYWCASRATCNVWKDVICTSNC
jgi:hypothetical protein